jgi:hypothetical protein
MTRRAASERQHHQRPSYQGALGPPPPAPPDDPLILLSARVRASTKRALKMAAATTGEKEQVIADRALRTELGLEP